MGEEEFIQQPMEEEKEFNSVERPMEEMDFNLEE